MASGLMLHIGTPKSGTTYLQMVLRSRRERLAQVGVVYPGTPNQSQGGLNHQAAVYGLGARHVDWLDGGSRRFENHLKAVVDAVRATRHRALLSAEAMVCLDVDEIDRFLALLGVAAADIRVIVTARDLARMLPSIWQQQIKGGATESLDGYIASISRARLDGERSAFWRVYDVPQIVRRWSAVVGVDHITVVTVPHPPAPPATLWRRFALAADLPHDDGEPLPAGDARDDNRSMSGEQAELLRAVNRVMWEQGMPRPQQQRIRNQIRAAWNGGAHAASTAISLSDAALDVVADWARADVEDLRASGVHVVASLDDLLLQPGRSTAQPPASYSNAMAHDVLSLVHLSEQSPLSTTPPTTTGGIALRRLQTLLRSR